MCPLFGGSTAIPLAIITKLYSGPVLALCLAREDAIAHWRNLLTAEPSEDAEEEGERQEGKEEKEEKEEEGEEGEEKKPKEEVVK